MRPDHGATQKPPLVDDISQLNEAFADEIKPKEISL